MYFVIFRSIRAINRQIYHFSLKLVIEDLAFRMEPFLLFFCSFSTLSNFTVAFGADYNMFSASLLSISFVGHYNFRQLFGS